MEKIDATQGLSHAITAATLLVESQLQQGVPPLVVMLSCRAGFKMMEQEFLRTFTEKKDREFLLEVCEALDKVVWQMAEDGEKEQDESEAHKPKILDAFGLIIDE